MVVFRSRLEKFKTVPPFKSAEVTFYCKFLSAGVNMDSSTSDFAAAASSSHTWGLW